MRHLTASVLMLVALLAPMLVAANVPDPTWIPGMYDGGDADEILILLWDGTPALVGTPPALLEPHAVVLVAPPTAIPAPPRLACSATSRAPPLA